MAPETKEEETEETVYDEDAREDLMDNDELSPQEEAFMAGYEDAQGKKPDKKLVSLSEETEEEEEY